MTKLLTILFLLFIPFQTLASEQYSLTEVAEHDTEEDCWMIYGNKTYDFTEYLTSHDVFMDIREWCGLDMTEDFETKAGIGRDHRESTYQMLNKYYIGEYADAETTTEETTEKTKAPYNLPIPVLLSLVLYWGSFYLVKNKRKYNAFWNTILIFTLLIPSLGFGIFMMLRYQFPNLWNLNLDFMYWHVELSLVMSTIAISHLIQRWKLYMLQFKK